jgi:hypothetical protein
MALCSRDVSYGTQTFLQEWLAKGSEILYRLQNYRIIWIPSRVPAITPAVLCTKTKKSHIKNNFYDAIFGRTSLTNL